MRIPGMEYLGGISGGAPGGRYIPRFYSGKTRYLLHPRDWNRPETGLTYEIYERAAPG